MDRLPGNANSSLSLFRVNAFSNARIATVFVCITTALSRLVSRPLEYRGICKFWVELGQLTRARSNQRFWGGKGKGKKWIGCFFFLHRYVLFIFFFTSNPARSAIPGIYHLSFAYHPRWHYAIAKFIWDTKFTGAFFCLLFSFFFFFFATIYSFNVTRDGER